MFRFVFKTKCELKWQNELYFKYHQKCLFWLLTISEEFFDVLFDNSISRPTKLQLMASFEVPSKNYLRQKINSIGILFEFKLELWLKFSLKKFSSMFFFYIGPLKWQKLTSFQTPSKSPKTLHDWRLLNEMTMTKSWLKMFIFTKESHIHWTLFLSQNGKCGVSWQAAQIFSPTFGRPQFYSITLKFIYFFQHQFRSGWIIQLFVMQGNL